MGCPACGKELLKVKETCLFCEGTGKQEDGDVCTLCDYLNQVTIVSCSDKTCSFN